jgi:hypothetical protein
MSETKKERPHATAYAVREFEREGKPDSSWQKIGVAWKHKDEDGFNIVLDCFPVNGRIVVRKNKAKDE